MDLNTAKTELLNPPSVAWPLLLIEVGAVALIAVIFLLP